MRVGRSTVFVSGAEARASALVDGRELWFKFPGDLRDSVSRESDPFAVAVLLVAMQKGEALEVEGTLSRRLWEGLARYQGVIAGWYPGRFRVVEVRPEGLREDAPAPGRGEAVAFSGGVDSFYAYLALKPRLTHGLFMAGFDMPLNLAASIKELASSYEAMFREAGKRLVVGSTNVRRFVNTVDWTNAHGTALAASALFFVDAWSKFHVPSSYAGSGHPKWGTHPALDPLLSTERLEILHQGASLNRVGKLARVARAPESHSRLRVCWIQDLGLRNCGECEKCLRTQIALELVGGRERYTTFDPAKFTRRRIRTLSLRTRQSRIFARELVREAVARGRLRTAWDVGLALARRRLRRAASGLASAFGSSPAARRTRRERPAPAPRA